MNQTSHHKSLCFLPSETAVSLQWGLITTRLGVMWTFLWQKLAETWIFYTCSGPQKPSLWDTIAASLVPVTAGVGVTFIWSRRRQFLKLLITYLCHLVLIWLRKNKSYLLFLKWHGETQNYFDINVKHIKIQTRKYLKARIQKKKCDARFSKRYGITLPFLRQYPYF